MSPSLDRLVDLRLRTAPGESPDVDAAREFLTHAYGPLLAAADLCETLHENGRLVGAVLMTEPQVQRFGPPEPMGLILCDPNAPGARSWAEGVVRGIAPHLETHCTIELNAADVSLLPCLQALGFGVAKVDLIGQVALALGRLRRATIDPDVHGVEFTPAKMDEASALNILIRDFFLEHPEHGWGGPTPSAEQQAAIDRRELAKMTQRIASGANSDFCVLRKGRIQGYFGFESHGDHPLIGSCAGINIVLQPPIQGFGVGKAAYLYMMERMHRRGIQTIRGRTSNPGVIHIGRRMGRNVRRYILRRDGPFISDAVLGVSVDALGTAPPSNRDEG